MVARPPSKPERRSVGVTLFSGQHRAGRMQTKRGRPLDGRPRSRASAVYVLDRAEEPVLLAIDAGGEEKRVGGAAIAAIAEAQAPQAFNLDRRAAFALQLAAKSSRRRVAVDTTIAEVPDQDVVVEVAKAGRREGQPPRRVEKSA